MQYSPGIQVRSIKSYLHLTSSHVTRYKKYTNEKPLKTAQNIHLLAYPVSTCTFLSFNRYLNLNFHLVSYIFKDVHLSKSIRITLEHLDLLNLTNWKKLGKLIGVILDSLAPFGSEGKDFLPSQSAIGILDTLVIPALCWHCACGRVAPGGVCHCVYQHV